MTEASQPTPAASSREKPEIDTWQVFGALLARYGGEDAIFAAVAQESGMAEFPAVRRRAQDELDAAGGPYTLEDVYRRIGASGIDDDRLRSLIALELRAEREQSLPIRRNIEQVGRNDMLLADTCLPSAFVDDLLTAAGARNLRPAVAAPHLLVRGSIWPLLQRHYRLRAHHRSGTEDDAAQCAQHGVRAQAESGDGNSDWENRLIEQGEAQLAAVLRECRLRSVPSEGGVLHESVCGPLLTAWLLYALELGERHRGAALLFPLGEADQWAAIFRALFPAVRTVGCHLPLLPEEPASSAAAADTAPAQGAVVACLVADGRRAADYLLRHADAQAALHALYAIGEADKFHHYHRRDVFDDPLRRAHALMQPGYGELAELVPEPISGARVPQYLHLQSDADQRRFDEFKNFAVHNLIQALRRRPIDALPVGEKRAGIVRDALKALLI